jgi:small subunit ribosomal protein S6
MFLLDNAVVREDWKKAKAVVTDTLEKHGATVKSTRRWDERKLAYPIRSKNRGTFLMCYFEMGNEHIAPMRREFELNERVLRYLILRAEAVPATELELSQAENAADFVVPAPPPDDLVEPESGPIGHAPDEEEVLVPDLEEVGGDDVPRGKKPEAKASTEA